MDLLIGDLTRLPTGRGSVGTTGHLVAPGQDVAEPGTVGMMGQAFVLLASKRPGRPRADLKLDAGNQAYRAFAFLL